MKTYRQTRVVIYSLILGHILIFLTIGFGYQHQEIFPFPSWSLFSDVSAHKSEFAILVTRVDGDLLSEPREFMDAHELFNGAGSIRAYYTIQDLGWAIHRRDSDEMRRLRRLLESTYMKGPSEQVNYQLISRNFDCIERWHGGSYQFQVVAALDLEKRRP